MSMLEGRNAAKRSVPWGHNYRPRQYSPEASHGWVRRASTRPYSVGSHASDKDRDGQLCPPLAGLAGFCSGTALGVAGRDGPGPWLAARGSGASGGCGDLGRFPLRLDHTEHPEGRSFSDQVTSIAYFLAQMGHI